VLIARLLTAFRTLDTRPRLRLRCIGLLQGGMSMLGRQLALNIGFVTAARRAQAMDPSGVAAAAYGIVMQLYAIGKFFSC
jgi:hypothetical protein